MTVESLANDRAWWNGPEHLNKPKEMWPTMPLFCNSLDDEEKKQKYKHTFVASTQEKKSLTHLSWKDTRLDLKRYSDWFRFVRVLAYVMRFVHSSLKMSRVQGALTTEETNDAEVTVLRQAQSECFPEVVLRARKGEALPSISPVLASDGPLRGNSRLRLADIAWEARHPIILPRKHEVTRLIVERLLKDNDHAGTKQILASLSARFWLPGAWEVSRECERACMVCMRRTVRPASQIMAPLLAVQSQMSLRAFTNISVDFSGPFLVKQGRGKVKLKRYLCFFACMNTRAIHLAMAYGLDTDSFYKMTSRRGFPA
ncbi:uncharacterized protein [Montipora foliosa]|uniref:uncharacterized protein n=1 Tax=Montipora foliosa TaxID=591990 RepID=UPI0035F156B9